MTALTAPRPGPASSPGSAGESGPPAAISVQRPARGCAPGQDDYLTRLMNINGLRRLMCSPEWTRLN